MGSKLLFPFSKQPLTVTDCNECQEAGMYFVYTTGQTPHNLPEIDYKWGMLIVFKNVYTIQFYIGSNGVGSYKGWYRMGDSAASMNPWITF